MYYEFLKEEFRERQDRHALTPIQLKTLKMVREAIKTRKIPEMAWGDPLNNEANTPPDLKQKNDQKQLVKEIHLGLSQIEGILHPTGTLYLYNIEHPCPPYGVIDVVYRDDITVYPLEVKTGEGKHDILGQIMKYELFFKLNLHLGHYQEVQPITMCSHYQNFVLGELKKRGIITLRYDRTKRGLKLYRI